MGHRLSHFGLDSNFWRAQKKQAGLMTGLLSKGKATNRRAVKRLLRSIGRVLTCVRPRGAGARRPAGSRRAETSRPFWRRFTRH
jgi:hypothetical protein